MGAGEEREEPGHLEVLCALQHWYQSCTVWTGCMWNQSANLIFSDKIVQRYYLLHHILMLNPQTLHNPDFDFWAFVPFLCICGC